MKTIRRKYRGHAIVTHGFTGKVCWYGYNKAGVKTAWSYRVNGIHHRELGVCTASGQYYLEGKRYKVKEYWEIMFEKYKGTEHEALCLSELLGVV